MELALEVADPDRGVGLRAPAPQRVRRPASRLPRGRPGRRRRAGRRGRRRTGAPAWPRQRRTRPWPATGGRPGIGVGSSACVPVVAAAPTRPGQPAPRVDRAASERSWPTPWQPAIRGSSASSCGVGERADGEQRSIAASARSGSKQPSDVEGRAQRRGQAERPRACTGPAATSCRARPTVAPVVHARGRGRAGPGRRRRRHAGRRRAPTRPSGRPRRRRASTASADGGRPELDRVGGAGGGVHPAQQAAHLPVRSMRSSAGRSTPAVRAVPRVNGRSSGSSEASGCRPRVSVHGDSVTRTCRYVERLSTGRRPTRFTRGRRPGPRGSRTTGSAAAVPTGPRAAAAPSAAPGRRPSSEAIGSTFST